MIREWHRAIFGSLGCAIAARPGLTVVISFTMALVLCAGNVFICFKDNFRSGYSEENAPSVAERQAYRDFYNITTSPYTICLVGECSDGGSMLRPEFFMEMKVEVDRGLEKVIPNDDPTDSRHTLRDYLVLSSEHHFAVIEESINFPSDEVHIDYPVSVIFSQKLSMRKTMFGVKNGSVQILLYYMIFRPDTPEISAKIKAAELQWYQKLKERRDPALRLHLFGDELVDYEILQGSINTVPYFMIGATLMMSIVFSSVAKYNRSFLGTLFLTFWTSICPLVASLMALSVFSLYGTPINCMMFITPFLILGVGVDDAFLMLHNWFHSKEIDGSSRFCRMLVEVGPSVSLTSFTNIAAFLIGSLMSPPDVRSFCLCTATALAFDWILQLFAFAPVLLHFHSCSFDLPTVTDKPLKSPFLKYSQWLRNPIVRASSLLLIAAYWTVSTWSTLQMRSSFAPEKTFDSNSFLAEAFAVNEKMCRHHEVISVIPSGIPQDVAQLHRDIAKIHELEYICSNFTTWIEDYEAEYSPQSNDIQKFFKDLPAFVDENPELIPYVYFDWNSDGSLSVAKLSFEICVEGFGTWRERAFMVDDLRQRLPSGYSLYIYDAAVFDLILLTRRSTITSVLTTIGSLILLCIPFIPSLQATLLAVISVVSIAIGVMGGLSAWGADLDIIVMVLVIMAVGLTVDYTAHISYHCYVDDTKRSREERVADAVQSIACPTALASATTIACVLPLYFYSVYMYITFTKAVVLCSVIGFVHAVFVIPLLVSFF